MAAGTTLTLEDGTTIRLASTMRSGHLRFDYVNTEYEFFFYATRQKDPEVPGGFEDEWTVLLTGYLLLIMKIQNDPSMQIDPDRELLRVKKNIEEYLMQLPVHDIYNPYPAKSVTFPKMTKTW